MAFTFLTNVPLKQAKEEYIRLLRENGFSAKTETVAVEQSCGRITAKPVYAHISAPHYPASAMDGIALNARLSFGATETTPVTLKAGSSAGREDFSNSVIENIGNVLYHGIAIKPGKPDILGYRGEKPVLGLPGYPVSGILVLEKNCKTAYSRLVPLLSRAEGLSGGRIVPSRRFKLEISGVYTGTYGKGRRKNNRLAS